MGKLGGEDDREARIDDLERRLAESERRLEETQALANIGSWEWVMHERQPWKSVWSKEMLRIFGRDVNGPAPTLDELLEAIHPEDRAGFEQLALRTRSVPGPFRHDYQIVDAEGVVRHLQARGEVIEAGPGRPRRMYGATQDISELKRSQQQLEQAQRLESVGQLAGGVAHDFNNLLSVILNNAECLTDELDDEDAVKRLGEVERAARSAAELTSRLLLFSRRDPSELRAVDLSAAVRDAEALLRRTIGDHVELTVDAPRGLPPVRLAAGQAEQILVNLAVNARDAMPGGGTIAIAIGEGEPAVGEGPPAALRSAGPHLVLTVADEGSGMTKEVAAQAFDPFFTTKPRGQGTGLGLATVYGIAGRVGGCVEIDSEPGSGTEVGVYLPVTEEDDRDGPRPGRSSPAPGDGRTVLVVDNEQAVQTIVSHMLTKHGYRTRTALGGAAAEGILSSPEGEVDLLLTDVLMPEMSGRELVARLRERGLSLPTIYMSGYGDDASPLGPWDEGVTVLQKPFRAEELLRAVGDALGEG